MGTSTETRLNLKMGIDARHKRVCRDATDRYNNTEEVVSGSEPRINLIPRRVFENSVVLAKDTYRNNFYRVKKIAGVVSYEKIGSFQVGDLLTKARLNKPKYAERFSDYRLYREKIAGEPNTFI